MSHDDERRLPAGRAEAFCVDVLGQAGVGGDEAALCAGTLVEASLRGVDSHGVALVAVYAERIRSGQIRPGRCALVRREGPATALLDGQCGLGPPLARRAVTLAAHKARRCGLGAVSLKDGNYVGALSTYVEAPAREGLLVLAAANATPRVAPLGGREGLHGTNPLAWAAPVAGGEPLLFDAATGHAAARVHRAADEGRGLAAGIALDAQGQPTTDPRAALAGVLLPVGAALGYGVGLLVDVLTGGLAAAPSGRQVPPVARTDVPYGCSFFALAVDPDFFGGRAALASACRRLVDDARDTLPAAGVDRVRAPGDRARATRAQRLAAGIPVRRGAWQALRDRLERTGVDTGLWAFERL